MNELTKLDVFAIHIACGIFERSGMLTTYEEDIEKAYDIAEKMLAESEKRNKDVKPENL